jgi:hypothetical protein
MDQRNQRPTAAERFAAKIKIDPVTGCHNWTAAQRSNKGYGGFRCGDVVYRAHRWAWIQKKGPIPEGQIVCHNCDNPGCVNTEHLRLDGHDGNAQEKVAKGRHYKGGGKKKLTEAMVMIIKLTDESGPALAKRFGVHEDTIYAVRAGKTWAHVTV